MIKDLYPEYYEELPQFNKKKKLDQEMGKGLKRHFSKDDIQMVSKRKKR